MYMFFLWFRHHCNQTDIEYGLQPESEPMDYVRNCDIITEICNCVCVNLTFSENPAFQNASTSSNFNPTNILIERVTIDYSFIVTMSWLFFFSDGLEEPCYLHKRITRTLTLQSSMIWPMSLTKLIAYTITRLYIKG